MDHPEKTCEANTPPPRLRPPTKRLREDDEEVENADTVPLTEKKLHPYLCFEDGNVIIEMNTYLCRVHRGILSLNSTVFSSLFSLPQPPDGEHSYEGIPIVQLADDNEEDVAILLRAMYERNYYRKDQPASYRAICALLRLSTKYAVDCIRKEVIDHLSLFYPSSLVKYEVVDKKKTSQRLFPTFIWQPFALLSLARSASADVLLPTLFYECASNDVDRILNYRSDEPNWTGWDGEDLGLCLAGRQKLLYDIREIVFRFLDAPCPLNCISPTACQISRQTRYVENFKFFTSKPLIFHRDYTQFALTDVWGEENMCRVCREIVKATIDDGRKELWERLPGYFGLPTWEVLKRRT